MAEVELKSVSKEYDLRTMGLIDVSLSFADGSLTTLVGMAGCGKSTLLLCICGLVDITSGDLTIGGRRMNDVSPKFRDVCLMRDGESACRGTVYDNISYGLRLRGLPQNEIAARTESAAELFGLADKLRVKMRKLSELDRRRTSLARCVVRRPSAALLDEPLFNLSDGDRSAIAEDIKKAHGSSGATFIVTSSSGADAFLCGGDTVVMRDGAVACRGSERELTESPPDMFAAAFLGENPMSFFSVDGETLGVRSGGLALSENGEILAEVVSSSPDTLLVKPSADASLFAIAADREYPEGSTVRLKIIEAARFDSDGKLLR